VDKAFDEAVPPQQRRDVRERVLDPLARLRPLDDGGFGTFGHGGGSSGKVASGANADMRILRATCAIHGTSADGIRAAMMRILRASPGAPPLRS